VNRRETVLSLAHGEASPGYVPAAFFLHFGEAYHQGQAAIDRHLEFFRATGMDLVKIQFEQRIQPAVRAPEDWRAVRPQPEAYFEPTVRVVEGLVSAAKREALVILTLYSPFMWMVRIAKGVDVGAHFVEQPEAAQAGLEVMTESVLNLVRACRRVGVDGFYASTQGGEAGRLPDREIFRRYIKPSDLAVWAEIRSCEFNVLHICDYEGGYDELSDFLDYPGQVVNASLQLGGRRVTPRELAELFGRPFLGGMERLGVIASGSPEAIRSAVGAVLAKAPERFMLGADCTVPADTPWQNLQVAIEAAHAHRL
jgi:uroporphyrinogen decarboxylase